MGRKQGTAAPARNQSQDGGDINRSMRKGKKGTEQNPFSKMGRGGTRRRKIAYLVGTGWDTGGAAGADGQGHCSSSNRGQLCSSSAAEAGVPRFEWNGPE